nr:hypothetical protein [uncultured Methanoregula sp.]
MREKWLSLSRRAGLIPAGAGAVTGPVIAWGTAPGNVRDRHCEVKIAGR